jgi:hypothetical protein
MTKIRADFLDPKIENLLVGGKKEAATIEDLLVIPREELKVGMIVTVTTPEIINYQLQSITDEITIENWKELQNNDFTTQTFIDLSNQLDGEKTEFSLDTDIDIEDENVYLNGVRLFKNVDYTLENNTLTYLRAITPKETDYLYIIYLKANNLSNGSYYNKTQIDELLSEGTQIQSDWKQTEESAPDFIKNKPFIPTDQVQSDWEQDNDSEFDFIKNKPSIPEAPIQSDWNQTETSALDFIKNKPTVATKRDLDTEISNRTAADTELQSQIDSLGSIVAIRGSVDTYEDLPDPSTLRIGDAYIVEVDVNKDNKTSLYSIIDTGDEVLDWDFTAEFTVDLSNYYTKTEIDTNNYTKTETDSTFQEKITTLPIENGGTGANNIVDARNNLGLNYSWFKGLNSFAGLVIDLGPNLSQLGEIFFEIDYDETNAGYYINHAKIIGQTFGLADVRGGLVQMGTILVTVYKFVRNGHVFLWIPKSSDAYFPSAQVKAFYAITQDEKIYINPVVTESDLPAETLIQIQNKPVTCQTPDLPA